MEWYGLTRCRRKFGAKLKLKIAHVESEKQEACEKRHSLATLRYSRTTATLKLSYSESKINARVLLGLYLIRISLNAL